MEKQTTKGQKGKGGRSFSFEISFMRMVAREYRTGNLSLRQLGLKYGVSGHQIHGWTLKFDTDIVEQTVVPTLLMTPEEQKIQDDLKKQNEELTKQLAYANLKATAFEMMIDIAEKELHIDIRKKSGTKPSAE